MRDFCLRVARVLIIASAAVGMATLDVAAEPLTPLSTFKDCDQCPEMVVLPPGEYLMGASSADRKLTQYVQDELPQHKVTIGYAFGFSKFEVTVGEFAAYVDDTGVETGGDCQLRLAEEGPERGKFIGTPKPEAERYDALVTVLDANFRRPGADVELSHPATCISMLEAKGYLEWLSNRTGKAYRLPSEAEWEYAARAGSSTPFYFGSSRKELCAHGNFADKASPYNSKAAAQCREEPSPVGPSKAGSYKPNAFGLYDMIGNVFEFTADCAAPNYSKAPTDGSPYVEPGCTTFAQRGYGFESMDVLLRSASRCLIGDEFSRSNMLGLRVAVTLAAN